MRVQVVFKGGAVTEFECDSITQDVTKVTWVSLVDTYPKLSSIDVGEIAAVVRLTR